MTDEPFDPIEHAREVRDSLPVGQPRAAISNLLAEVFAAKDEASEWKLKWRDAINHADRIAAEDEELRAELDRLRERKVNVARTGGYIAGVMQRERDEARAEVERLEADLDGAAYRAGRKQGELKEAQAWAAWFAAERDMLVQIIDGNGC